MFLALPLDFPGFTVGLSKYSDLIIQRLRSIAQSKMILRNDHDLLLCRPIVPLPSYIENLSPRLLCVGVFAEDCKSMSPSQTLKANT